VGGNKVRRVKLCEAIFERKNQNVGNGGKDYQNRSNKMIGPVQDCDEQHKRD